MYQASLYNLNYTWFLKIVAVTHRSEVLKLIYVYTYVSKTVYILTQLCIYYIKLKKRLSVCPHFGVTLLTQSVQHGSTQDLVCVIAVVSGTSKFVFINFYYLSVGLKRLMLFHFAMRKFAKLYSFAPT